MRVGYKPHSLEISHCDFFGATPKYVHSPLSLNAYSLGFTAASSPLSCLQRPMLPALPDLNPPPGVPLIDSLSAARHTKLSHLEKLSWMLWFHHCLLFQTGLLCICAGMCCISITGVLLVYQLAHVSISPVSLFLQLEISLCHIGCSMSTTGIEQKMKNTLAEAGILSTDRHKFIDTKLVCLYIYLQIYPKHHLVKVGFYSAKALFDYCVFYNNICNK